MIVDGKSRGGARQLADYLLNDPKHDYAALFELRGVAAQSLAGALQEMECAKYSSHSTRARDVLYSTSIDPEADAAAAMTPEQWRRAVDILEATLGLEGYQRAAVMHVTDEGRQHLHVVWGRIHPDTGRCWSDHDNYIKHEMAGREMEREFGHAIVSRPHLMERDEAKPDRQPEQSDWRQAMRRGVDLADIIEMAKDARASSDSGRGLVAALEERGLVVARGDRRDFLLVYPTPDGGAAHLGLHRALKEKAAPLRDFMGDIDKARLPSLAEAKDLVSLRHAAGRMPQQSFGNAGSLNAALEPQREARVMTDETGLRFNHSAVEQTAPPDGVAAEQQLRAAFKEQADRQAAQAAEMQQQKERLAEHEALVARRAFKEQADRQAVQATEMQQQKERLAQYEADLARRAEDGRKDEARRDADDSRDGMIRNAESRYGQALGQHYDVRDPFGSLARAAMAEYGAFLRDRETLDRQISVERDPALRQALEARKQIEAAEYMAITSDRIARQSEVIVGRSDTREADFQRERAASFRTEARDLRQQYAAIHQQRAFDQNRSRPAMPREAPQRTAAARSQERPRVSSENYKEALRAAEESQRRRRDELMADQPDKPALREQRRLRERER